MLENRTQDGIVLAQFLDSLETPFASTQLLCDLRKAYILNFWPSTISMGEFTDVQGFFKEVLDLIDSDFSTILTVLYQDPILHAHKFLALLIGSVQPSFPAFLSSLEESSNDDTILHLVKIYEICLEFESRFEKKYPYAVRKEGWGDLMFESFIPYQRKFEILERKYLEAKANGKKSNWEELIRECHSSVSRYLVFTSGLIKMNYYSMIDQFIVQSMGSFFLSSKSLKKSFSSIPGDNLAFQQNLQSLQDIISFSSILDEFWRSCIFRLKSNETSIGQSSSLALKTLRREYHIAEAPSIFKSAEKTEQFITQCQADVLKSLLLPVDDLLFEIQKLSTWDAEAPVGISFSLSPQGYITSIGEYLLTLPQYFDPLSHEAFLQFSLQTLPLVNDFVSGNDYEASHIWIISAARLIEEKYATKILQIQQFSSHGVKQLATDARYLKNIMAAIDIEPIALFADILYAAEASETDLKDQLASLSEKYPQSTLFAAILLRSQL